MIAISVDSLLNLPTGASYHSKNGQAGADVSKIGDTIYVTATCDSLEREVEYFQELYCRAREDLEAYKNKESTEVKSSSRPFSKWLISFLLGFICGATIDIYFNKNRKNG